MIQAVACFLRDTDSITDEEAAILDVVAALVRTLDHALCNVDARVAEYARTDVLRQATGTAADFEDLLLR